MTPPGEPLLLERLARHPFWQREILPDPHGIVGFALAAGVLFFHLTLPTAGRSYLWSENLPLEIVAHIWLIASPPVSVYLGLRNLLVEGVSPLPLISVPLGVLLSLITGLSVVLACFLG